MQNFQNFIDRQKPTTTVVPVGKSPFDVMRDELCSVAYRSFVDLFWTHSRVIPQGVETTTTAFVDNQYDEDLEVDDCLEEVTTDVITYIEDQFPTITCGRGSMFRRQLDQDGWEFVQNRGGNTLFRQKVITKVPKEHPKEERRLNKSVRRVRRNLRAPYIWSVVRQMKAQFYDMSMEDNMENRVVLHKCAARIMRDHGIRETAYSSLAAYAVELYYIPQSRDRFIRETRESRSVEVATREQSARLLDYGWQSWWGIGVRTPRPIPRNQ